MPIEQETGLFWLGGLKRAGVETDTVTWVEEVAGRQGGGGAAGVWFPPRSLPQPLLIPWAGSRVSLSEPNTPPFTSSAAGAGAWGRSTSRARHPGPKRHPYSCQSFRRELLDPLPSCFQKPGSPTPREALPHKTWTPKTRLKHTAPFKSTLLVTAGWGPHQEVLSAVYPASLLLQSL